MNHDTYISIIIPCYNAEYFLDQTIKSVMLQSFENWELLLINDGSIDKTEKICRNYSNLDNRIKCITTENKGAGHARNIGIKNSRGKWILFLDADDLFLPDSINSSLFKKLKKYENNETDIIYTSIVRVNDINLHEPIQYFKPQNIEQIKYRPNLSFGNGIYRKSFLIESNVSFFEYKEQDIETAFRYIAFTEAKKIACEPNIFFYLQRNNPISNTHTWNLTKLHYIKALVYNELLKKYSKEDSCNYLYEELLNEIHAFYKCSVKSDIPDIEIRKRTINKIYFDRIKKPLGKCLTKTGKRHFVTTIIYFYVSNILKNKSIIQTLPSQPYFELDNTETIMKRLNVINEYIQICIIGV